LMKNLPMTPDRMRPEFTNRSWTATERNLFARCGEDRGPLIMGILNVTPDSFYDGGVRFQKTAAVDHGLRMAQSGAHIIDVGGESTRPGAEPVPLAEELDRVVPVVNRLREQLPEQVLVSVDTYKSAVASAALAAGADIINDISFGTFDENMAPVVAASDALYVGMHIQGTPRDMQQHPHYQDVVKEVRAWLADRVESVTRAGIPRERIILDPGIGFGKNDEHNLSLLRSVPQLRAVGCPVLIGASRKSFMGRLLGLDVADRLAPSVAVALHVAGQGAAIVRVHDVAETAHALRMQQHLM